MKHVFMEEAGAESAVGGAPSPESVSEAAPPVDDWRQSLPPELKDNPSLQDVSDVQTLAKRFVDTKAMVGGSVRIPTSEAGQEAVDAFTAKLLEHENLPLMRRPDPENPETLDSVYKTLGRPDDPSGYAMPEGADAEAFGAIAAKAHELGLSKQQFEALSSVEVGRTKAVMDNLESQRLEGVGQLKGEWGLAFPEKVSRAADMAKATHAPEKLVEAIGAGAVDAATLRWLDSIADSLGTEGSPMAGQINNVVTLTPSDLQQRIDDRTRRILDEKDMSQAEKERLIQSNVEDMNNLVAGR